MDRCVSSQQDAPVDSAMPVLCTYCAKVDNTRGIPVCRGALRHHCMVCGVQNVVRADGEGNGVCTMDPDHEVKRLMCCTHCDATEHKQQVITTAEAVPYHETVNYGGDAVCLNDNAACSEHLFRAHPCGHTYCHLCLMKSVERQLQAQLGGVATAATSQQFWHLAEALVQRVQEANIPFGNPSRRLGALAQVFRLSCLDIGT